MREFREIRKGLGDNADAAAPYLGVARTQLGILKARMAYGRLGQLTRTITLEDGASITVSSRNGQDSVRIVAAPASQPAPPSQGEFHEVRVGEPDTALVTDFPPDVVLEFAPGVTTHYSAVYSSSILKGAVMDKTGTTAYLAYASPDYHQGFFAYETSPNASQLVKLDKTLKEVGRSLVAMPDWWGQLTYDYTSDSFYLVTWTGSDGAHDNNPTRAMVRIGKDGSATQVGDGESINTGSAWPALMWGNSEWNNLQLGDLAVRDSANPLNWSPGSVDVTRAAPWHNSSIGSNMTDGRLIVISQPSSNGLIAALFQGDNSTSSTAGPFGFPLLWSTVTQSIVWRGNLLGTYRGTPILDSFGDILGFTSVGRFDQWAISTPNGNAVLSINGEVLIQPIKGDISIVGGPPGTLAMAVTKGDKTAYAITATSLYRFTALTGWKIVSTSGGTPLAILHDQVTNAVAYITQDLVVTIFNGTTLSGELLAPFGFAIKGAPTNVPGYVYPQQFINGSLLITYSIPYTGASGAGAVEYIVNESIVTSIGFPPPLTPSGQPSSALPGQTPAFWTAHLNHAGGLWVNTFFSVPTQTPYTGVTDAVEWVIGKYDMNVLKQPSSS